MSNPAVEPVDSGATENSVDAALRTVEHQISLFWRRGRSISQQLSRQVHPDMEPAAYGLLTVIRREGPIRLTELASCIGVGKPSVSRQIAFLESIGLVSKEADPLDGRAQTIRLTPKGEEKMHQVIAATQQKVETLRREIDVVKVNESVQRAQASVAASGTGANAALGSAADSLKRIKERQAIRDEKFKSAGELEDRRTGADLDAKLRNAGILPGQTSADDILARLSAPKDEPMQIEAPALKIEAPKEG